MAQYKKNAKGFYRTGVTIGYDESGKMIRKYLTARKIDDLKAKVEEVKRAVKSGMNLLDDDVRFGDYARMWLDTYKINRGINTRQMYEHLIRKQFLPIHGIKVKDLRATHLQALVNENSDRPRTCEQIRMTLRQIYAAASDEDGIDLPRINLNKLIMPKKKKNEKRPLNDAEKAAVVNAPFDEKHRVFVWVLYYTGMRREEALALMPSDFDFKAKTVTVSRTLVFDRGRAVIVQDAKSSHSLRTILLPDKSIDLIREYVSTCGEYVFPMKGSDEPMSMASFRRFWETITRTMVTIAPTAAELTPHMFRHNYATQLYYSGITIKKAAQLMGHADTTMIMKVYAHLDEEKENTAAKLNAVF